MMRVWTFGQEGEDMLMKDGYFTTPATANVGVSPYKL